MASLTSGFRGTYNAADNSSAASIDGSSVTKNLTIKGQKDVAEYIIAGGGKKTMIKGQGSDDTLVGSDTGVDTFYYKKGETGAVTISNFGDNKDKIKISGSKVVDAISSSGNFALTMTNGASITVDSISGGASAEVDNVLIKANNTYYWFTDKTFDDVSSESHTGGWVTSLSKISNTAAKNSGLAIIDLGYSTNLVKAGLAYKTNLSFSNVTATGGGTGSSDDNQQSGG